MTCISISSSVKLVSTDLKGVLGGLRANTHNTFISKDQAWMESHLFKSLCKKLLTTQVALLRRHSYKFCGFPETQVLRKEDTPPHGARAYLALGLACCGHNRGRDSKALHLTSYLRGQRGGG